MANEARITSSLNIRMTDGTTPGEYQSRPSAFVADVSVYRGPTPGLVNVTTAGTDIDLSALTTPGLCRIMNLDTSNYVTVGMYEPDDDTFYPMLELLPGESYVVRLHRFIAEETTGTGTTLGGYNSRLRIKADTATCPVLVEAFER